MTAPLASSGPTSPHPVAWITAMIALTAAVLGWVTGLSRTARETAASTGGSPPAVRVVSTAPQALASWRALGQSGRVLIHLGRYLQFDEPEDALADPRLDRFPYPVVSTLASGVTNRNLLWVLMRTSVARQVIQVLPPDVYAEKCQATGCEPGAHQIRDARYGLLRIVTAEIPKLDERVLVQVDASLFASPSGAALWRELLARGPGVDAAVFNLATDNEQVPDQARELLRAAAREYTGGHVAREP